MDEMKTLTIGGMTFEIVDAKARVQADLPTAEAADNGKFLRVVNGSPAWVAVHNAEEGVY